MNPQGRGRRLSLTVDSPLTRRKENERRVSPSVTRKEDSLISVGDRVSLTDARMTHTGTVTTRRDDGICTVKWDSGMTERLHESELGRPDTGAYAPDDPKSEGYTDRMADIWDSREK